jgi:cysteine desulfurase family protein
MDDRITYLDNAATTFPKPRQVLERMLETYARMGVSPGRGGYDLAVEAEDLVEGVRARIASFFGSPAPERVVFASNATDALNLAIQGLVGPGDHVVSTRLEHNSVLRPLHHLKQQGCLDFNLAPFDHQGLVDPQAVARAIRPNTRLVIVSHASNVLGTVQPVAEIGRLCAAQGVPLLIDAAQSAGQIPIDLTAWQAGAVAFTGHKSLLGPTGIGGLVISPGLDIKSTRYGGTGVDSKSLIHTQSFPHRLEAGTLNLLGIIGLGAGLDYLEEQGLETIRSRETSLLKRLHEGLSSLKNMTIYSPPPDDHRVPVLTCNVDGLHPTDAGAILDGDYGIAVRTGLHCAPLVHEDLGTDTSGAVRFSLGVFNTEADIDLAIEAMARLAGRR